MGRRINEKYTAVNNVEGTIKRCIDTFHFDKGFEITGNRVTNAGLIFSAPFRYLHTVKNGQRYLIMIQFHRRRKIRAISLSSRENRQKEKERERSLSNFAGRESKCHKSSSTQKHAVDGINYYYYPRKRGSEMFARFRAIDIKPDFWRILQYLSRAINRARSISSAALRAPGLFTIKQNVRWKFVEQTTG